MARNKLTGEPEFEAGQAQVEGASLNGGAAPEGSADRVRDGFTDLPEDDKNADQPVTVTDYDANGEAIDVPVTPRQPQQADLGILNESLNLWGDYHGRRVGSMALSFSGTCDLVGTRSDVRLAAPSVDLGRRLTLRIGGKVTGIKHKSSEDRGPVDGVVTLAVDDVLFADEAQDEADDLAERIQAALTCLGDFHSAASAPAGDDYMSETEIVRYIDDLMQILNGEEPAERDEPDAETSESDTADTEHPGETGMLAEALGIALGDEEPTEGEAE